jgi:hypothetical protein
MPENVQITDIFIEVVKGFLSDTHTCTIARVVAVNDTTIDVKPVINAKDSNGIERELPVFPEVPVVHMQGGSSYMAFPISIGDYCLLVFSERCIDRWWSGSDNVLPAEFRMHDYSDGFAIVGIRNESNGIEIPSIITTQGDSVQDGDYTLNGDQVVNGNITINGNLTVNGNINSTGGMSAGGEITCSDAVIGGIRFSTHVHGGVVSGGSDTEVPK